MDISNDPVTWRKVKNTVTTRLIDFSLVHNLGSQKKLRRGTRVLNTELKKLHGQKSYSQYVKIKTAVLRNLSDDSEISYSDTSPTEDYENVPKRTQILKKNLDLSCKEKSNLHRNEVSNVRDSGFTALDNHKIKSRNSAVVNLGWQRVVRKRKRSTDNLDPNVSENVTLKGFPEYDVDVLENLDPFATSNAPTIHETRQDILQSAEAIEKTAHYCPVPSCAESPCKHGTNDKPNNPTDAETPKVCRRNDYGNAEDADEFNGTAVTERNLLPLPCNIQDSSIGNKITGSPSLQKNKNNPLLCKEELSFSKAQPKDSGIDEDSKDESLDVDRYDPNVLPSNADFDTVGREDSEGVARTEVENSTTVWEKDAHKYKLQPKVTCTEIVNKKYKIISGGQRDQSCSTSDYSNIRGNLSLDRRKTNGKVNPKDAKLLNGDEEIKISMDQKNVEDNMSPSTQGRLEQLRRLNLTSEGEANSSDEDSYRYLTTMNAYWNGGKTIKKSTVYDNNVEANCFERTKNCSQKMKKKKRKIGRNEKEGSASDHCHVGDSELTTTICERPQNLQEFIELEDLLEESTTPSLTLKDMCEDDMYIMEIPKTVFDGKLLGSRIVLTEKKLKLGKQRFTTLYRNIDTMSCVFATGKSRRPYKTVNVKPTARIIARPRMAAI